MEQVPAAGSELPQLLPAVKSPDAVIDVIARGLIPAVSVTVRLALRPFNSALPKFSVAGDTVAFAFNPVPDRGTVTARSSVIMDRLPDRLPETLGVKTTLIEQLPPGAT